MLKNCLTALFAMLFTALAAQSNILAVWDFSKPDALKGSIPMTLKGASKIVNGALVINPSADLLKPSGIISTRSAPFNVPKSGFELSVDFTLDKEQTARAKHRLMLLDYKYVTYPKANQQRYNNGFQFYMERAAKADTYYIGGAFGYGKSTHAARSNPVKILSGKLNNLLVRFTGSGKVQFFVNNKPAGEKTVPAGFVTTPRQRLSIGDRNGNIHWPFTGSISKVELRKFVPPPAVKKAAAAVPSPYPVVWDFSKPDVLKGKVKMRLTGKSRIVNGALVIDPPEDLLKPAGAVSLRGKPLAAPKNSFELTVDFTLDKEQTARAKQRLMLFDYKYVLAPKASQAQYHNGFMLYLSKTSEKDQYYIGAAFGFGDASSSSSSRKVNLPAGKPQRITMHFTAVGRVKFTVNGIAAGESKVRQGPVTASALRLSIGNRNGNVYWPFPGSISRVELREVPFQPISLTSDPYKRTVFMRGEDTAAVNVQIVNHSKQKFDKSVLKLKADFLEKNVLVKLDLKPGEVKKLSFPVSPWLLPGQYYAYAELCQVDGKVVSSFKLPLFIAPQRRDFMPVILWGATGNKTATDLGFTHQHTRVVPDRGMFTESLKPDTIRRLDGLMREGLYAYCRVVAKYRFVVPKRFLRKNKNGQIAPRINVEASHPEVRKEYAKIAEDTARYMGSHPAWDMVLSNSEVRDNSSLSYAHKEPENFRKFAGFPVPEHTTPRSYKVIDDFPWDQLVSDQRKDLIYFRWFYREGDGWNPLHELICKSLHKYIKRPEFTVFYDPVTRVPPLWGSGGNIDAVSQWTYTNPDPIKIGQATDEVIAMADGFPGQKVMSMTQAIWYRNRTAPIGKKVADPPEWLQREPKAVYITIPPDALKIALWTKLARRLDGIMYHGVGSLIEKNKTGYRYTNPYSKVELKKLADSLIKPLGPVLTRIPERLPEVAILESFTSSIYAPSHFPQGWSRNWIADLHLALQWNHIQAAILYEEHLYKNLKTGNLKVLFVPGAEVLTDKLLAKLQDLQKKGVIIVGDEFTSPALMPDLRLKSVKRTSDPQASKKAFQKLGREIAEMLKTHYRSPMQAANQDIVLYRRGTENADCIFVINDKRTYCDYLGQWKLVMAKGLPNSGNVTLEYPSEFARTAAAYDLVKHCQVPLKKAGSKVSFENTLPAAGGRMIMILKQPIGSLKVTLPAKLRLRDRFQIKAEILDVNGKTVKAIMPVEVTLTAKCGKKLPGSGFYSAIDGKLAVDEVVAPNMLKGPVKVTVKCLSSGKTAEAAADII